MIIAFTAIVVLITMAILAYSGLVIVRRVATAPTGPCSVTLSRPMPIALRNRVVGHAAAAARGPTPGRAAGLSKQETEDLLDWLEATGRGAGKLSIEDQRFTVVWHQ